MDYKELKIVKYNNNDDNKQEYQKRFSTIGVIKTEMYPSLMKRDLPKERDYPLFVVPLLEVQLLSQQIQENSNTIKELANALPAIAKEQFYKEQLYKSIIDTNEIEGVKTTRKEVSEAFKALSQKGKNHKIRLLSTVRMYHDIITQEDLRIDSINIIREIYDNLTDGEIEGDNALDGYLFRDGYINILDENTGKLEHLPPTEEKTILIMLSSWISFINDRTVPFLIKASLSHFFFENVHPFYDGNGRTGRYILSRYLSRKLDIFRVS
ncbi:Fic family protein [Streptococcus didelphis]|uniref:Fic family protein n=1 Tax=Streptococcus didelphis TaxID=102886 RepID=UPI0027D2855A|nr:Fic family protein [Streptococcus didelphis]WMB29840.1 Fic family protein [Streptococcus didelphis]